MKSGENFTRKKTERTSIIPVRIVDGEVFTLEYHGSAHINAMTQSEYVISIPAGVSEIKKGEPVYVRQL